MIYPYPSASEATLKVMGKDTLVIQQHLLIYPQQIVAKQKQVHILQDMLYVNCLLQTFFPVTNFVSQLLPLIAAA